MAGWKQVLDESVDSIVIHRSNGHTDASIGTSPTGANLYYNYIGDVDGEEPAMEPLTEEQVTQRLVANNIDPENNWR